MKPHKGRGFISFKANLPSWANYWIQLESLQPDAKQNFSRKWSKWYKGSKVSNAAAPQAIAHSMCVFLFVGFGAFSIIFHIILHSHNFCFTEPGDLACNTRKNIDYRDSSCIRAYPIYSVVNMNIDTTMLQHGQRPKRCAAHAYAQSSHLSLMCV